MLAAANSIKQSVKAKGDISSLFSHLGGKEGQLDPKLLQLKKEISPKDSAVIANAYQRLMESFEHEGVEIKRKGSAVIPQISYKEIEANGGRFPAHVESDIRRRGCIVVRGVVPENEARGYKQQVESYIDKHPGELKGFPSNDPQVWEIYWSQSQATARSHPHFNTTATALNQLWHAEENTVVDLSKNLGYCDRLRIRKPGDNNFALQEHIDSGSLERWQDPEYRKCYSDIFAGNWEKHDSFDATHRVEARMDYYNAPGGCSVFRSFQGWIALSDIKTGAGTLRVCPLLQQCTASFLMKPLTEKYIDQNDFLGALPGLTQGIAKKDYPEIAENMVSMPDIKPGDCVFWHCDQVHAVEQKNDSEVDSSVMYIPAVPMCRINSEYLKIQRDAFEKGQTPPDFPGNNSEEAFEDRAMPSTASEAEKTIMGLVPFPELPANATIAAGQKKAIDIHNKIMGFD